MTYNPDNQSHHLMMDLADNMQGFKDFDNAISVLIEWGLIEADIGAQASEIWVETEEN
jgi:hypothetical protein